MKRELKLKGRSARLSFKGGKWDGHYRVPTKGRSAKQIAAAILKLDEHHAAKAARLERFSALWGTVLDVHGVAYRWQDCTIRERGTDVELFVCVTALKNKTKLRFIYPSIADVPSDEEIADLVRDRIIAKVAAQVAEEEKNAAVLALLNE
jgi:hypothetical protein